MKMKTLTPFALAFALISTVAGASLATHPGYADLSDFEHVLGTDVAFDVDFDRESLAALLALAGAGDERLTAVVESVDLVRARAFTIAPGEAETVLQGLEDTADRLKVGGWSTLASVRDGGDRLEVFLRLQGDRIAGVAALFFDGKEAGFANVVGDVGMAEVMALAPSISSLRSFLGEVKDLGETDG